MHENFPVIIVSGLSGSGKSTALHVFEDMGFFVVDGLPVALTVQMVGMFTEASLSDYKGIVLGMDLRQSGFIAEFQKSAQILAEQGYNVTLVFLETTLPVLMKRYASTRRPHPLQKEGLGLQQALELELSRLQPIRQGADYIIDTTTFSVHDLRRFIQSTWSSVQKHYRPLRIHVVSFGFKYGMPADADMVFDLRFLPNPYFTPHLKELSGKEAEVASFVMESDLGKQFYQHLTSYLDFVLDSNEAEGRFRLTIAVGCTGGRHRSVAISEALVADLRSRNFFCSCEHRHLALG